jgi:hypothetical protein
MASERRGLIISVHDMNCSWRGVLRPFVDDSERNRVKDALRKNGQHMRSTDTSVDRKRHQFATELTGVAEVKITYTEDLQDAQQAIGLCRLIADEPTTVDLQALGLDVDGCRRNPIHRTPSK